MFAYRLMEVFAELTCKGQLPFEQFNRGVERFKSLRAYGLLPRGRELRGQILTAEQVASAVLGLTATSAGWAGHVALVLSSLKPVGGIARSFDAAGTLREAIAKTISSPLPRPSALRLTVTAAEHFTNAVGFATFEYSEDSVRKILQFVPAMVRTMGHAEAADIFWVESVSAPCERQIVFNGRFFERLRQEFEIASHLPPPDPNEGWEYDEEDMETARLAKLRVKPGAHFLNVGVDNQVSWPKDPTAVKFDSYELILLPKTKDNVQSIHFDLTANRLSHNAASTVVSRFLSMMSWCSDNYAVLQGGWSGNPVPVPVPRRNLAFVTAYQWSFDRKLPASSDIQHALALYREALNAHHNSLVGYAVVSYCKVIEIQNPKTDKVKRWIKQNFARAQTDPAYARVAAAFEESRGLVEPAQYLWACRVATAHGMPDKSTPYDPDNAEAVSRLSVAADVFHILARIFIVNDLGISVSPYSGD